MHPTSNILLLLLLLLLLAPFTSSIQCLHQKININEEYFVSNEKTNAVIDAFVKLALPDSGKFSLNKHVLVSIVDRYFITHSFKLFLILNNQLDQLEMFF